MPPALKHEIAQQRPFASIAEEALLNLMRTADCVGRTAQRITRKWGITSTQYNVLRILRGAPQGLPCGEIAGRLITRDPDVTRLLDRMEKRGLISRARESRDRRMVLARLTPEGRKLVDRLDEPVQKMHRKLLGHLGKEQVRTLRELLAAARATAE